MIATPEGVLPTPIVSIPTPEFLANAIGVTKCRIYLTQCPILAVAPVMPQATPARVSHEQSHPRTRREDPNRHNLAADHTTQGPCTEQPYLDTQQTVFPGNCLFPGRVGKTWEPGGFEELPGDVSSQLFGVYGDDTVVYPGHGDDTTLGDERPHLEEWRERGW